ncbi:MAG: hypothetical protein GW911_02680 [Armatimonadetes bacterium]|nr:hypothetical protein [Armatimonadota bacterium]NCP33620.1 hypothetical protein [Armatimonadota bacterium]NDK10947.1 hypothetical protein [Armatimonadota bacterium]PJB66482.1 MAG: hypothetical protein CO096_17005 [Armatimonadetes bacterium CG_4_9_14_3_um_filter_66_14]
MSSSDSLALDNEVAWQSLLGTEEILLRSQLLFDVVFAADLSSLHKYALAVVPNQRCLADDTCARLLEFVDAGGRALVTGNSGNRDEHLRLRLASPLTSLRENPRAVWLDGCPEAVVPVADHALKVPRPAGLDQVVQAVSSLLGDRRPIRVSAPEEVFVEGYRLPNGRRTFHFVNYASDRLVEGATATVSPPATGATWHTPEETAALDVSLTEGGKAVCLPNWQTYGVLVLEA